MTHTLPAPVRAVLEALTTGLRAILGARLVGVYVGGSLVAGDFYAASSDVDFLAVTDGVLTDTDLAAVAALHDELRARYAYGARLEGDYAPREWLVPQGTLAPVPGVTRGVFQAHVDAIMLSADNIYNVRAQGLALHGPSATEVLPSVTPDEVRAAVREMLREGPDEPEGPQAAADEVLNLVRSLAALKQGKPATKSEGAAWALAHLAERWQPVIRAALAIRAGDGTAEDEGLVLSGVHDMHAALRAQYAMAEQSA